VVYPKVGNVIWASEFPLVRALTVPFEPSDKGKCQDQIKTLRVRDRRFGRSSSLSSETSEQCMPFPLNTQGSKNTERPLAKCSLEAQGKLQLCLCYRSEKFAS
jgi:hypothetical protein